MIDKKFTDEEIIKALECCISTTTEEACAGCPFNKQKLCDKDQWALERYALDLINRQRTEIERLKSELSNTRRKALYKAGDKVVFVDGDTHGMFPEFYPEVGTVGTVVGVGVLDVFVKWEKGSTTKDDTWYCGFEQCIPASQKNITPKEEEIKE